MRSTNFDFANSRFFDCDRCFSAVITISPLSVHLLPAITFSLSLTDFERLGDFIAKNRNSTLVSTLLICCPPGPEDFENLSDISEGSSWIKLFIFILVAYIILNSRYGQNDYVQKLQVACINNPLTIR